MKQDTGGIARKILVIGLDGGTYAVLQPFIKSGKMPTLAALMKEGSWGELTSTIPPLTAPAWASFITGKNPGKHGVFQFGPVNRSLYKGGERSVVNSTTLPSGILWDIIGGAGKTVGVLNVPLTYPPRPINGFMVTGMLTPRDAEQFTYPSQLASFLGDYQIDVSVREGKYGVLGALNTDDPDVLSTLIEQLSDLVKMRTKAAIRLVKMHSPDFFMLLFTETDRLQHVFWPYLAQETQHSGPRKDRELTEAVEQFFQQLDDNLARLLEVADENAIKIIMSDHGFGAATTKNVNFNIWLENQGLLRLQKTSKGALNPKRLLRKLGLSKELLYSSVNRLFPGSVVRQLGKTMSRAMSTPFDWNQTRAVFIPIFEFVGGIEIIHGTDSLMGNYEDLRDDLIRKLLELRDPETQQLIVLEAFKREQLYQGVRTAEAPDIIFIMAPEYRGEKGLLSKSLVSPKPRNLSLWTGTHRKEGLIILNGPNISPGRMPDAPAIQDLTPTILYLLGIPIPEDMDGQVIHEAIEASYLAQHEIVYGEASSSSEEESGAGAAGYSQEEAAKVRKHLEDLGYFS
ncbi:alkaline phosphatase family protein [Candidatus Zixiibacteriota bacterium]